MKKLFATAVIILATATSASAGDGWVSKQPEVHPCQMVYQEAYNMMGFAQEGDMTTAQMLTLAENTFADTGVELPSELRDQIIDAFTSSPVVVPKDKNDPAYAGLSGLAEIQKKAFAQKYERKCFRN